MARMPHHSRSTSYQLSDLASNTLQKDEPESHVHALPLVVATVGHHTFINIVWCVQDCAGAPHSEVDIRLKIKSWVLLLPYFGEG